MHTDFEKFNALTEQQVTAQAEVDRIGAERARLLAQLHIETGLSYANIGAEVGLKRGTVQQLVERGRELMPRHFEIIASNGRDVSKVNPTPIWGYTGGQDDFVDFVLYQDGDTIADAVARFQNEEKLPAGSVSSMKVHPVSDYWVHEDHPHTYLVRITPQK